MLIWVATGNQHKMYEFTRLLDGQNIQLKSQKEIKAFSAPVENGKTFLENAQIKARALASVLPNEWVMAEDSGLVCEGLNGSPGIYSARYAGDKATDIENVMKVLQMMKIRSPSNRKAYFHCSLVVRTPQGQEYNFEGKISGNISLAPKGEQGFGYDPVFIPDGETKTMAELGETFKMKNSHRAKAIQSLLQSNTLVQK